MTQVPRTEYATIDDGYHIAYQTFGQEAPDLLFVRSNMNHLELQWEEPHFAAFLNALATFSRVIVHDDLGTGMSDSFPTGGVRSFEQRIKDVIALLERTQSERVVLVTETAGTFRSVRFAAAHPERVSAIVLCESMARVRWAPDYPFGITEEQFSKGQEAQMPTYLGEAPPAIHEWFVRYTRLSVNRGSMNVLRERFGAPERDDRDVRSILPALHMPALVIQHADSWNAGRGRYVADLLPTARYVELPGKAYGWRFPDPGRVASLIEEFVTGEKSVFPAHRVLATLLFTDVVGSTSKAAAVGDRRWMSMLAAFDEYARGQIARFGGRLVKSTGDGHLATFDAPGRAIQCAGAMRDGVARFELEIRAGLHTGEIETHGEDVGGLAVNIARRVCDAASGGTVLVSGAIPPLVAGSGLEFEDRGEHELKGVPGRWQLCAVKS